MYWICLRRRKRCQCQSGTPNLRNVRGGKGSLHMCFKSRSLKMRDVWILVAPCSAQNLVRTNSLSRRATTNPVACACAIATMMKRDNIKTKPQYKSGAPTKAPPLKIMQGVREGRPLPSIPTEIAIGGPSQGYTQILNTICPAPSFLHDALTSESLGSVVHNVLPAV